MGSRVAVLKIMKLQIVLSFKLGDLATTGCGILMQVSR